MALLWLATCLETKAIILKGVGSNFCVAVQAELVAQFLCCIPLAGIEALLTWLKPAVPQDEQDHLLAQVNVVDLLTFR